ncbi:DUF397 domain-containing protein [Streptomyces antarcticus]|uniref:DUF397 domain-containing protein n=1 Tax=Streptomyces antarcticus TaxID=2996458 RepID=UPI00226D4185|nr:MULTISPECIES: DUF397 domain-containing protein [unclassified Streptomyces]MCY0942620.1 DUF397 domain-containing protein [Streptomyces sp. H34-AA3]MCZ4081366.1 DUF397 domain-containing protein [Streptomyces sp. H34-S5]
MSGLRWVKSTYSQNNGGECIEWSPEYAAAHDVVPVRDSKVKGGAVLTVSPSAWAGLVALAAGQ